jgi:hypothetical protein
MVNYRRGNGVSEMIMILDGQKVEIDDKIAKSIKILNQKGFKTFTCCSGHADESSFYGYVCFENRLLRKYGEPEGWGRDCDILPEDHEEKHWKQSKRTIRYFMFEDIDDELKEKYINMMINNLLVWVKGLPNLNKS